MGNDKNIGKINSSGYPRLLKEADKIPEILYYKGQWDNTIFEKCLAVVGSRRMSKYGREITKKLVSEIAASGITIVSGFMYGIDATAHKAALEAGGRTIAVMPCGIEMVHPEYQKDLYEEILKNNGLIVSEFEGMHPPAIWTYPRRNKIVAGLSAATLVVEAGEKSGSLITAEAAKRYKRKVFAVPGSLNSSLSKGCFKLIAEGASMITSTLDVLKNYEIDPGKNCFPQSEGENIAGDLPPTERIIFENLKREPMGIDELSRLAKVSASQMGATLSIMQIKGLLQKEEEKYYVK